MRVTGLPLLHHHGYHSLALSTRLPVYLTLLPPSDVHVYVGRCLGTIVLAHPSRLLDTSDDSLGVSLPDLTAEVERAGRAGSECSDTYYIVDIVLPLLCR